MTSPAEDPKGWCHYFQGTPVALFEGLPWRQLMKKHHLLCAWENCIFLASYWRAGSALETLKMVRTQPLGNTDLASNKHFWAHSIWKRSHSSKDIGKKLRQNSDLRHNFVTGSSDLKPISRCSPKASFQKTGSIYSSWGHILTLSGIKLCAECSSRWLKNSLLSPKSSIYAFKA